MALVTANGIETHDRVDGRTGALRLVLLHSPGSDLRISAEAAERLRDRFKFLLVDRRPPEPARRVTSVAPRTERDGLPVFTFDSRRQGEAETVFLDM
ncbi:hypothetical protein [uncultured Aureimonas sp.]|uniref:hypothetical protein n=1 Tax=uncultured Aureimonas sp. TaxID=1604662 RepID=UPI0025D3EC23|nr:hypothetical protein [uncultured Aureimonas sp.]